MIPLLSSLLVQCLLSHHAPSLPSFPLPVSLPFNYPRMAWVSVRQCCVGSVILALLLVALMHELLHPSSHLRTFAHRDFPLLLFGPSCTDAALDAALSVFCSLLIVAVSLPDQMTDLCRQSGAMSQLTCLRGGAPLPDFWAFSTISDATMQPLCSHYAGACEL
jgi:hypothetical protein